MCACACVRTCVGAHMACTQEAPRGPAHLVHGVRAPAVGVRHVQHVLPVLEVGDDLEGLGDLAHRVPARQARVCAACWVMALGRSVHGLEASPPSSPPCLEPQRPTPKPRCHCSARASSSAYAAAHGRSQHCRSAACAPAQQPPHRLVHLHHLVVQPGGRSLAAPILAAVPAHARSTHAAAGGVTAGHAACAVPLSLPLWRHARMGHARQRARRAGRHVRRASLPACCQPPSSTVPPPLCPLTWPALAPAPAASPSVCWQ